jgi:hypothetical protein
LKIVVATPRRLLEALKHSSLNSKKSLTEEVLAWSMWRRLCLTMLMPLLAKIFTLKSADFQNQFTAQIEEILALVSGSQLVFVSASSNAALARVVSLRCRDAVQVNVTILRLCLLTG